MLNLFQSQLIIKPTYVAIFLTKISILQLKKLFLCILYLI